MALNKQDCHDRPISLNPVSRFKYLPPSDFSERKKERDWYVLDLFIAQQTVVGTSI